MTPRAKGIAAVLGYVASIYAANWLVSSYGLVPVLLGLFRLIAPAGVYAAGACLTLRNVVQDHLGRVAVIAAIVVGAVLSWLWASPRIAFASGVTFLVAELCDMAVYTPLRKHGWARAVMTGNLVGAVIDSILFLHLAGLWSSTAFFGQLAGKYLFATLAPVAVFTTVRYARSLKPAAVTE